MTSKKHAGIISHTKYFYNFAFCNYGDFYS